MALAEVDVGAQPCGHAWTERDIAGLGELGFADDEQPAAQINVRPGQPCDFANAQTEPVEEREDGRVGQAALGCLVAVRQRGRGLEKLAGMRQVEQVWKALRRLAPRPEPHRGGRQYLLVHHPVEQASHHPEKMIIAAWVPPGPARQEGAEHGRRHAGKIGNAVLDKVAVEQAKSPLLSIEAAVQGTLVRDEAADRLGQRAAQVGVHDSHGSASPSPRAMSRSVSTATLV